MRFTDRDVIRTYLQALALGTCAMSFPALAVEPTGTAIEFYNAGLNHYFTTAYPDEAAMLDAGTQVRGWSRTGVEFKVWARAEDRAGSVPVCRFFGTPGSGPDSHFYTANAQECALVRQNPKWTFESIAYWIDLPDASGKCAADTTPVYRSFYPGKTVSESNHRFLTDLTMHQKMAGASILEGVVMCSPLSSTQVEADVVRLLEQATFGPQAALVARVQAVGIPAFLDEQFAARSSRYPAAPYVPVGQQATFCAADPDPQCGRDYYSLFLLQNAFFRNAIEGNDQLRQRVAFALSQIFVTSGLDINVAYGMGAYQQIFLDGAFGNFESLMTAVTLSSVMGDYLNMVNNDKPAGIVAPNENYARELLQLFTIGVWELASDGTKVLDAAGQPIPSYDQDTIEGFAHVFTGWTYPVLTGVPARAHNPKNFLGEMVAVANNHDTAAKGPLLNDITLPAGAPMQTDLAAALHNVFIHRNVGPFIGRQLIQKLVTGDPSPQYVARVASAFNDNGQGVRGDLKAVIRAVLVDPEARGAVKLDPGYGKLREPALFMAAAARAVDARSDGVYFGAQGDSLGQRLFYPASVFNYYPPTYVVPGTSIIGPEFAIQNASTAINRYNFANTFAFGTIAPITTLAGATGTQPDWSGLTALASDPNALIDRLDALLLHRTLGAGARAKILAAIAAVPATDPLARARTAFYLIVTSSSFQVER
ncbi:MAG: DUF1800 family protein [Betaproteobacteria bacterium]